MSRRVAYWHDPNALTPNSLVPGGAALITDEAGRILMQRRADSGLWSMPGGVMEIGESIVATVVREVAEETGLMVEVTGVAGIYTDPCHVIALCSQGHALGYGRPARSRHAYARPCPDA